MVQVSVRLERPMVATFQREGEAWVASTLGFRGLTARGDTVQEALVRLREKALEAGEAVLDAWEREAV